MAQRGRPRIEIDKRNFEKLCIMQCRKEEISAFFECTDDTLNAWCKREYKKNFSEVFAEKRVRGFIALRRVLYKKAIEDEDTKVMMYLGDNWLGMREKVEVSTIENDYDLSKLTKEELQTLKKIANKANAKKSVKNRANRSGIRKKTTSGTLKSTK